MKITPQLIAKTCLCTLFLSLSPYQVLAQETPTKEIAQEAPQLTEKEATQAVEDIQSTTIIQQYGEEKDDMTASDKIYTQIEGFLEKTGLKEGHNPNKNGKYIYVGTSHVPKPVTNANFETFKYNAFRAAHLEALGEFIRALGVRTTTESLSKRFADEGTADPFINIDENGKGAFTALLDKTVALAGGQLDTALEALGIDPTEFNAVPADQKKVMMQSQIINKTVTQASKSIGGVSIVQTFFADDTSGNAQVGVIIMYSPAMEGIAQSLRIGKKPVMPVVGKPLAKQIPLNDPKALYDTMGPRLLLDENGPIVVTFGQAANSYKGTNNSMKAQSRRAAEIHAEQSAIAQISEFLGMNFTTKTKTETGNMEESALVKSGKDQSISEINSAELIKTLLSQSSLKSANFLQGINTLKKWRYTTPQGHDVVGIIKVYSFNNMEAAKNMKKPAKAKEKNTNASAREGAVVPDLDVF